MEDTTEIKGNMQRAEKFGPLHLSDVVCEDSYDVDSSHQLRKHCSELEATCTHSTNNLYNLCGATSGGYINFGCSGETLNTSGKPITCFIHRKLTPSRLLEHLKSQGASDACIVEWTRRLAALRQEADRREKHQLPYGIHLLAEKL